MPLRPRLLALALVFRAGLTAGPGAALNRMLVALALLAFVSALFAGEKDAPKVIAKFAGSVEDDSAKPPPEPVIMGEKELAALWKAWKLTDKMPKVDFGKELVIVSTTSGSSLDVTLRRDDKGDLKVSLQESEDSPPGVRYVIQVIERAGIKSVNGKGLK